MRKTQLAHAIADLELQIKVLETAKAALLKLQQADKPKLRAVKAPKESA